MERLKQPFSSLIVYLYVFLITQKYGRALRCSPSSSCGQLTRICYPFRLKTDPSYYGSPEYELLCKENKTILQVDANSYYYVTSISYVDNMITVVDPTFIDGNCSLPSVSLPLTSVLRTFTNGIYLTFGYADLPAKQYACFVNCVVQIHQNNYLPVRCLSKQDGAGVYAIYGSDAYSISNLEPSCSFVGISSFSGDMVHLQSSEELFSILQKGFVLRWYLLESRKLSQIFHCIKRSVSEDINFTNNTKEVIPILKYFLLSELECVFISTSNLFDAISLLILVEFLQLMLVLTIASRFVFAPLSILVFTAHKFLIERLSIDSVEKFLQNQERLIAPKRYGYTDIIALTGHFKVKLGQGGFGSVFRGKLLGGQQVAIKMLETSKFNGDDFINEVSTLGRIHHVNVVRLLGYCAEGSKRALVYEYMPNGSLDKYIFSGTGKARRVFSWDKINEMALGIALGIDYLHRGCDVQILHFDIKPHNILLDNNFKPKISDFGLAKLYPRDRSLVFVCAMRGTIGYIAPELVSRSFGVISYKSDVYSFGMLLLEMTGGRRNAEPRAENTSQIYYPSWIYDKLTDYKGIEVERCSEINGVERKLCIVGLWCIQMKSSDRPPMNRVLEMLEGDADSLQMPPPPFFASSNNNPISNYLMNMASMSTSAISEEEEISLLGE